MTEKGQITLPVAWRRKVGTNAVRIKSSKGALLEIAPIENRENKNTGWVSVFEARRDNGGEGITSGDFLRVMGRPKSVSKKRRV